MARASRLLRLPTSGAVAGKVRWTPSADTWLAIEKAYGVKLTEDMRAKVTEIVDRYFASEAFARNAPFVKDAIAWLNGLQSTSAAFVAAYHSPRGPQPRKQKNPAKRKSAEVIELESARAAEDDKRARRAIRYLEDEIDDYMQDRGCGVHFRARDLVNIMTKANAAIQAIAKDIGDKDNPRYHEKDAWRQMVRRLWEFATENELPSTIDNNSFPKVSAFVRFFAAIQSTFGDDAKAWHKESDLTLAEMMKRAIADLRET